MKAVRQYLWFGALVFGLVFVGLGIFFVTQGFQARAQITTALAAENVPVSADAEKFGFGVPAGVPVTDAKTALAQSKTIERHSTSIKGAILVSGVDTTLRYADMKKELFVSPDAYNTVRNTYITGLTLRTALNMAVMGYGVADMAIASGAAIIPLGLGHPGRSGASPVLGQEG